MENKNIVVNNKKPASGMTALFGNLLLSIVGIAMTVAGAIGMSKTDYFIPFAVMLVVGILVITASLFLYAGLRVVHPNCALVLTLFGEYYRTIDEAGFYFVNPFATAVNPERDRKNADTTQKLLSDEKANAEVSFNREISLKTMALDNGVQKVNDVLGNPIVIGAVVIWKVVDPTRAVLCVDNYKSFLSIQTDSTVRNIARLYPYDVMDDTDDEDVHSEKTLRGSSLEIAESMKAELEQRVEAAGISIEEVRITHLAYSEEIAAAMLQRQQAAAVIAARQKIVDGAVSMVKMAIDKLGDEEIVILDEERKAQMVSNLMVVLCSSKDTQPIINSGSIY